MKGIQAFGYAETGIYPQAEKAAKEVGIPRCKWDNLWCRRRKKVILTTHLLKDWFRAAVFHQSNFVQLFRQQMADSQSLIILIKEKDKQDVHPCYG